MKVRVIARHDLPPHPLDRVYEAAMIQVEEQESGSLAVRLYDRDLEFYSVHGYGQDCWAFFETVERADEEMARKVEDKRRDAEHTRAGYGQHL